MFPRTCHAHRPCLHRLTPAAPAPPAQGKPKRRELAVAATQARIPWSKQVWTSIRVVAGPMSVANGITLVTLMKLTGVPLPTAWWPESAAAAVWQLVAMAVIADFGLYWGHRVQHEFEFLWRYHRIHHSIDTPTPFSTMYIHPHDATLQGGIPMALAALLVRPAPAILYLAFAARVAENAINHTGLDSWVIDLFTLKLLPFRAPSAFHDAHHKYSNHARNAKNYGETFWVWDWLFGTTSSLHGTAQGGKL
jgi:sterol desaturase/sphingolipid hydroxylase (fatty acid hydroxylase superfamily)